MRDSREGVSWGAGEQVWLEQFFFLGEKESIIVSENAIRARILHRSSPTRQSMSKLMSKSRRPQAPAPAVGPRRRAAPQDGGSAVADLERLTVGLSVAHTARVPPFGSMLGNHRDHALKPDRPARRLRSVASRGHILAAARTSMTGPVDIGNYNFSFGKTKSVLASFHVGIRADATRGHHPLRGERARAKLSRRSTGEFLTCRGEAIIVDERDARGRG